MECSTYKEDRSMEASHVSSQQDQKVALEMIRFGAPLT